MLVSPKLDKATVAGWEDQLLERVSLAWLRAVVADDWSPATEMEPFESISAALRERIHNEQATFDQALVRMLSPVDEIARSMQRDRKAWTSIMQSLNTTRLNFPEFTIPRYELPLANTTSALRSLTEAYHLSDMRSFIDTHRPALDVVAQFRPSTLPEWLGGRTLNDLKQIIGQAPSVSSMVAQLSSADISASSIASLTSAMEGLRQSATQMAELTQAVQGSLQSAFATILPKLEIGSIFPWLPDLTTLAPQFDEMRRASAALEEGGFSFANHLLEFGHFAPLRAMW